MAPECRSFNTSGELHDTSHHHRHARVVGGRSICHSYKGSGRYSHRYPRGGHCATIRSLLLSSLSTPIARHPITMINTIVDGTIIVIDITIMVIDITIMVTDTT